MMLSYQEMKVTVTDRSQWTLPAMLRWRAAEYPDKVYLDVPSQQLRLTYGEVLRQAENIGRALLRSGCRPGDRVLIMADNCAEYILAWFGSAMAGLIEVPINTAYRGSFLDHQVDTVAPRVAVVGAKYVEPILDSAPVRKHVEAGYVIGDDADAIKALGDTGIRADGFSALTAGNSADTALPDVSARDTAAILFTSGTTGLSKGVEMPHAHMYFFADQCVSLTRLTSDDVYMSVGPLFHGNAQFLAAYPAVISGARFVLQERFSASNWTAQLRESGATVTNFVGVMMDWVYKQPRRSDDADNNLRCLYAVPLATSIADDFAERFGIEAFVGNFGLTETSMPIMTPYGLERPAGASGLQVAEYFDVKLVDPDTDEEVPDGEVGELVVRAKLPWIMTTGYYGMPDKTAEAQRNLWFHTGDALRRDAEGWYYFVDRLKDALRRRGENISSFEVEQPINEMPGVVDCAVIGVAADEDAGEDELLVAIVRAPDSVLDAEAVWQWCDRKLPKFAVPRYIRFVDELPMTPSGKVRKAELRAQGITESTADRELVSSDRTA